MGHDRVPHALDLQEARQAGHALAERRRDAREFYKNQLAKAAEAKQAYRKRLAQAHVEVSGTGTAHEREAKAKELASKAELERDIAEGMVRVAQEKLNEVDGERATLHRLMEWSMRLDPFGEGTP